jgi:hypothetical protein
LLQSTDFLNLVGPKESDIAAFRALLHVHEFAPPQVDGMAYGVGSLNKAYLGKNRFWLAFVILKPQRTERPFAAMRTFRHC